MGSYESILDLLKSGDRYVLPVLGKPGMGKSTLETALALLANEVLGTDNVRIYSNMEIGTSNYVHTPCMLLPQSELSKCDHNWVICDDTRSVPSLNGLITVMASMGRKDNCSIILSGQRYTFINPTIRELCTAIVRCCYDDSIDKKTGVSKDRLILRFYFDVLNFDSLGIPSEYGEHEDIIWHNISKVFPFFDTKKKVTFSTQSAMEKACLELSKTTEDLEQNAFLLWGEARMRNSVVKRLSPMLGEDIPSPPKRNSRTGKEELPDFSLSL